MAKLYIQQIRPHLEYGAPFGTHTSPPIPMPCMERVYKFALRMCLGEWLCSYEDLLEVFNLPTLENHRHLLLICLFFKLINGLTIYPSDHLPITCTPLRPCHDQQFYVQPASSHQLFQVFIHSSRFQNVESLTC